MPSLRFHISRSISSPEKAREIHEALDNIHGLPFFIPKVHGKWRKLTHNVPTAAFIGYTLNGRKGVIDALNHLKDDLLFNKMFYDMNRKRGDEKRFLEIEEEEGEQLR